MPLENVIDDLLSQARNSADAKIAEANEYREKALSKSTEDAEAVRQQYGSRLRRESERLRREAAREAEIEVKRERHSMMKRVLDSTYDGLLESVSRSGARSVFMPLFIAKAVRELGGGTLHLNPDYKTAKQKGFRVERDLKSQGLIAESEDRSVVLDMTLDTLLTDFWQQNIALVSGLLFS